MELITIFSIWLVETCNNYNSFSVDSVNAKYIEHSINKILSEYTSG